MGEKGLRRWSGGGHVSPSEVRRTRLKYQPEEWAEETGERGGQQVAWTSQGSLRGSRLHGDVGSRQPDCSVHVAGRCRQETPLATE